jgi:hypothetical protein
MIKIVNPNAKNTGPKVTQSGQYVTDGLGNKIILNFDHAHAHVFTYQMAPEHKLQVRMRRQASDGSQEINPGFFDGDIRGPALTAFIASPEFQGFLRELEELVIASYPEMFSAVAAEEEPEIDEREVPI